MSDLTTGVISGCEVNVDDGLRLGVSPGWISDAGAAVYVPLSYVTLSSAPTTGVRTDSIWAELDDGTVISTEGAVTDSTMQTTPATGAVHLADVLIYAGSTTADLVSDRRVFVQPPAGRVFFTDYIRTTDSISTSGGINLWGATAYLGAQDDPAENGIWISAPTSGTPWTYAAVQPDRVGDILRAGTGPGASEGPSVWIRQTAGLAATGMQDVISTVKSSQILTTGTSALPPVEYPQLSDALDGLWNGEGTWTDAVAGDWDNNLPMNIGEALNRIAANLGPIT